MTTLWLGLALGVELTLTPLVPVEGEPVKVQIVGDVDLDGAPLRITYRPNSAVEATDTLALDGAGAVMWTPSQPGIAVLSVDRGGATVSRNVSVRFGSVPWSGVLVFLGTGLLLFGGASFAMRRLFQDHDEGLPLTAPPLDT